MQDLEKLINEALNEDIGPGDYTSLACINKNSLGKAVLLVKENGIIAGIEETIFLYKKNKINTFLKK